MTVPHRTAPSGRPASRSVQLTILAIAIALAAVLGATNPQPAAAAGVKVVIIVGPVGSSTSKLHHERQAIRGPGPLVRSHRRRGLQPERHMVEGQGRRPGREGRHLSRPWQRLAESAKLVLEVHEGRLRAQCSDGPRQLQQEVLRRVLHPDRHQAGTERRRRPQPAVLRLGQLGVGLGQSDEDRREGSGSTTTAPGSSGQARGRSSRRGSPTRRTSCTACSGRAGRSARSSRARRTGSARTTSSSARSGRPAIPPGWPRRPSGATTARSSAT